MAEETYRYYVVFCSMALGNLDWDIVTLGEPFDNETVIRRVTADFNEKSDHNYVVLNWKRIS